MTDEIVRKVIAIIAEHALLESDEVGLDASPDDLGLDSLALVEIVFAIEEEFDIAIPFNANEPGASNFDISSVASIAAAVKNLLSAKG